MPHDEDLRLRLIGLGERSLSKSYYPQLRERLGDLERLRSFLDMAKDAFLVLEAGDLTIVEAAGAVPTLFGRETAGLIGHKANLLFDDAACQEMIRLGKSSAKDHQTLIQAQTLLADQGVGFFAEISLRLFELEGIRRITLMVRDVSERVEGRLQLLASEQRMRAIFNAVNDAILILRADDGVVIDVNRRSAELFGYARQEMLGKDLGQFSENVPPYDLQTGLKAVRKAIKDGPQVFEWHAKTKDGNMFWTEVNMVRTLLGVIPVVLVSIRDISDRKAAQKLIDESYARFRKILDASPLGLLLYRSPKVGPLFLAGYNPAAEKILDTSLDPFLGKTISDVFPELAAADIPRRFEEVLQTGHPYRAEHLEHADHLVRKAYNLTAFRMTDDEMAVFFEDATKSLMMERKLRTMALADPLTGLANRALLADRLNLALKKHRRNKDQRFVVLFVDLDRFKPINDALGHTAGDVALREVARRLVDCVREVDTVARFGGDEFVVLLDDLPDMRTPIRIVRRIQEELRRQLSVGGHSFALSASIGILFSPDEDDDPEALVHKADMAMKVAKERGKNRFQVYTKRLYRAIARRLRMESDITGALLRTEFRPVYQPICDLMTGKLLACESLVRWSHPSFGELSPGEFIDVAEKSGQIGLIDRFMLNCACRDLASLGTKHAPDFYLTVNVSSRELSEVDFATFVLSTVTSHGIEPSNLCLEITESSLMAVDDAALQRLAGLRGQGVKVAVDDFGTGYSSLAYLTRLPLDIVKIDLQFIREMLSRQESLEVVKAILGLAGSLKLTVVAEGIETTAQHVMLAKLGCPMGQGYLFSKPKPFHEALQSTPDIPETLLRSQTQTAQQD